MDNRGLLDEAKHLIDIVLGSSVPEGGSDEFVRCVFCLRRREINEMNPVFDIDEEFVGFECWEHDI